MRSWPDFSRDTGAGLAQNIPGRLPERGLSHKSFVSMAIKKWP
jgi:hypothetical protein